MSQIYKLNHIEGEEIKNIYIFSNDSSISEPDFIDSNDNHVFTTEELDNIQTKGIPVEIISTTQLHGDDTIGMIKKKLVHALNLELSTKELYLFGITTDKLNSATLYKQLTHNETIPLSRELICKLLLNIVNNGCSNNEVNATCPELVNTDQDISFDDFLNILDWDEVHSYTIPIGQRLISAGKTIPFIANPYNCVSIDRFVKESLPGSITTQNANLLFEAGDLCQNNIFFCTASEVLEHVSNQTDIEEEDMINLYFPLLGSSDNIANLADLNSKKQELLDQEEAQINSTFLKYNSQVNMFYDIYKTGNKSTPLEYLYDTPGITAISVIVHPIYEIKFPLEILFKLIHSTREIPMIKYNPGSKKENIYRLFTGNNIATNGKKIPFLYTFNNNKKTLIIKISKIMAHSKRVSFLINLKYNENNYDITCSISDTGTIYINIPSLRNSMSPLSLAQIEEIIDISIKQPILNKIKIFLEQSGYTYVTMDRLTDKNVEIQNITWVAKLKISSKIDLNKYVSCLSTIFAIEKGSLKKSSEIVSMRYKRVSSYNKMSATNAFITELRKQDVPLNEILNQLQTNFRLSKGEAEMKLASWASEVKQRADLFENKRERTIITNVGFPVIITRDATNNIVTVTINTINNVQYLKYIHIYIDSVLRLFVNKKSTGLKASAINNLCKGKALELEPVEEDIEANDDRDFVERDDGDDGKIVFQEEGDDVDDFLDDILGSDDEDDDDDDEDEDDDGENKKIDNSTPSLDQDISFGDEISFGDDISFGDEISPAGSVKSLTPLKQNTPTPSPVGSVDSKEPSPQASSEISEAEIDLTGLPLRGAKSIFMQNQTMKRGLMWRDPKLFIKQGKGRYSTACPSQYDKQPIVLTGKEKNYIDEKDASFGTRSYDESITYGTGNTKYHYICPRFWCLNDENGKQRSITLKEINEGGCGGWDALIPRGVKKIPAGKRIYEFTDQRFHRERYQLDDTNNILVYKPMYPGFQERTKHPNNLCIPCCFGRPRGLSQEAIKQGWSVEEKDKKLFFKNKEGKLVDKNQVPRQAYDGTKNTDLMFKPEGKGPGGAGPSFDRDENGNIILSSIKGTPQLRELPAGSRIATFDDCNESSEQKVVKRTITRQKSIGKTKMEEAPAWEVFPLKTGQLGYLPEAVQRFFQYNQRPPKGDSSLRLKVNKPIFLRKGMERSKQQSFLACIADIYDYKELIPKARNKSVTLTHNIKTSIENIKTIIKNHLTLDNFITYQNGTLVDIFYSPQDEDIDVSQYESSRLYRELHDKKPEYLLKIIIALNNFKDYLSQDDIDIDYQYLWDIICIPVSGENENEGGIFDMGLNLLILKSPDNDITNKIEVICPTNFYGSGYFDEDREILILYTRNGFYEPIYKYTRLSEGNKYRISKLFYLPVINRQAPQLANMINYVKEQILSKCKLLPSDTKYKFKENISLISLVKQLKRCQQLTVEPVQVLNLNTKVIGVLVQKGKRKAVMVPCRPSALNEELPFVLADDPDILNTFTATLQALQNYSSRSCKIPCKPILKIVNNNVTVGIVTETNQFIPVIPEPHVSTPLDEEGRDETGLIIINNNNGVENYLTQPSIDNDEVDEERINAVNNIKLESQMYNSFRNILRIVLNQIENSTTVKQRVIDILNNITIPYYDKLREIIEILHSVMDDYVTFTRYNISSNEAVKSILKCINLDKQSCNDNPTCLYVKKGGKCKLQIPETNLISGGNNEEIYFGRLADEMIRYSRIRMFILNPRQFLSFQQMSYNLKENEIILLEDILYGDYFEDIVPRYLNPYIGSRSTFDTVEPAVETEYKDTFILDNMMNTESINECLITNDNDKKLKLSAYLRTRKLSPDFGIMEFKHKFKCTWEMALFVLKDFGLTITVKNLQDLLIQTYSSYMRSDDSEKIIELWKKEGKTPLLGALKNDLTGTINTSDYYLTPLDLFIIFSNYDCPVIITSRTKISLYAHLNLAFYSNSIKDAYIILGGAWNTKRSDGIKLPIYGILQRNGSIRLPLAYFGEFSERLVQNPLTTFNEFYEHVNKKQKIKLGKLKIKKKSANSKGKKVKKLGKIRINKK